LFNQIHNMKKSTQWISGIHLHQYSTKEPDGTEVGWDADWGEMVAWKGKLISLTEYKEKMEKMKKKKRRIG